MRGAKRDQSPPAAETEESTEAGPALRDALVVSARADTDEREALLVREHLLGAPLPSLNPDPTVAAELRPIEVVHSHRASATLSVPGADHALGYGGSLYLTSQRLIHIGQVTVAVHLKDIVETSLAGERLLITLSDGNGVALDVERPRTFRTEIAAALRGGRQ